MRFSKDTCPDKAKHTKCPEGYVWWHEWAIKKQKTHVQLRCPTCRLYTVWKPKKKEDQPMKRLDQKTRATFELLLDRGTQTVFQEALRAVTQALYVMCSTEIEAAEIRKREKTEHLEHYWRGRHAGAWTVRRHADQLEPIAELLYKLVTEVPLGTVSRDDLKKKVRRAKALGRPKD